MPRRSHKAKVAAKRAWRAAARYSRFACAPFVYATTWRKKEAQ